METLDKIISAQTGNSGSVDAYNEAAKAYQTGNTALELECLRKFTASSTDGILPEMIAQVKQRLSELEKNANQLCHPVQGPQGPEITGPDKIGQVTVIPPRRD